MITIAPNSAGIRILTARSIPDCTPWRIMITIRMCTIVFQNIRTQGFASSPANIAPVASASAPSNEPVAALTK